MGNGTSRVVGCFVPVGNGKDEVNLEFLEPLDEGLGHSFCYVRPVIVDSPAITPSISERYTVDSSTLDSDTRCGSFRQEIAEELAGPQRLNKTSAETTFRAISGASVSANASAARTGNPIVMASGDAQEPAASFESTASFAAVPLQPVPRGSGPLNGFLSGPLERGFASGPLERGAGFMSGPLDKGVFMSGPIDSTDRSNFSAPLGYGRGRARFGRLMRSMSRPMRSALSRTFSRQRNSTGWMQRFLLHPMTQLVWHYKEAKYRPEPPGNCLEAGTSEPEYSSSRNLQWAHGKAGEDRVHVVLSEEQGWLFVGIYDGFNGPDAPDFLMSNLYKAIDKELEGLLWDYEDKASEHAPSCNLSACSSNRIPSDIVKEESNAISQLRCGGSQNSHLPDDNVSNLGGEGGLLMPSCKGNGGSHSNMHNSFGDESGRLNQDIDETGTKDINMPPSEASHNCSVVKGDADIDTERHFDVVQSESSSTSATKLENRSRKSKRLYELLQMELLEEHDKGSHLWSNHANIRGSLDSRCSGLEDLCVRETPSLIQPVLCSSSIERETIGDDRGSLRENDAVVGPDSTDPKQKYVGAAFPSFRQTKMLRISLFGSKLRKIYKKHKSSQKKLFPWTTNCHRDPSNLDERIVNSSVIIRRCKSGPVDHEAVLKAMARALETTEEAYVAMVNNSLDKNPELALMGSCLLVMLMKDQDVYIMNLGDSRAILAQDRLNEGYSNLAKEDVRRRIRSRDSLVRMELDRISEESPVHNPKGHLCNINNKTRELSLCSLKMRAVQLSSDHSTSIEEEVLRIKAEHADDPQAVCNGRVKGQLKVTRAFGAEFLKKPDFNGALLEMFRVDYIGDSPYISCIPSLVHHRLCSSDRFLVLSSDGLYQYFSNEEVVAHVTWFMENAPEGDPAQYLIAELLIRAAKMNGMDFHELLDIPQGDRRKYHDDVSVMVISLEGRIWRSSS